MTDNFREFSLEIDAINQVEFPQLVAKFQQKLGLEALRRVVLKTPVDTGRARANWQTSLGSPVEGVLNRVDPSGGVAIAEGTGVIVAVQPFQDIWLSNNVPYIISLEDGSSKQAPAGMVAVTIGELQGFNEQ